MPPASRTVLHGLPTALNLAYVVPGGVIPGGIWTYMSSYDIGTEGGRMFGLLTMLSASIMTYYWLAERYSKRYGAVDV